MTFADKNQRSIFWDFEFRESVFFWVLVTVPVFLGLLDKRCILKCFICSTVIFWFQFYSPGYSITIGLHYCLIMLDFCKVNSVLRVFFRILLSENIFLGGFSVSGKGFFLGRSEMPNSADPCL